MIVHVVSQFVLLLLADARRLDIGRAPESVKCKPNIFILGGSTVGKGTVGKELEKSGYQGFEIDKHLWRNGTRSFIVAVVAPGIKRRHVYREAANLTTSTPFFIDESVWFPNVFDDVFDERYICKVYMFKHLPLLWDHTIKRNREAAERQQFHEVRSLHVVMSDLLNRYATLSFDPCHDNVQEESAWGVGETLYLEKIPFKEASEAFGKAQRELHELATEYPDLQEPLMEVGSAGDNGYSEDGVYGGLIDYINHDRDVSQQPLSHRRSSNATFSPFLPRTDVPQNATAEDRDRDRERDRERDRNRNRDREKKWLYVCPRPSLRDFRTVRVQEGHSEPRMLADEIRNMCADKCESIGKWRCVSKHVCRHVRSAD